MLTAETYSPLTVSAKGYHIDPFQVINLMYITRPFFHNTALFDLHPEYPEFKELFDRAYASTDMAESLKLMKELNQKLYSTAVFTQIPSPFVYHAYQPWVENYYGEDGESVGGLQRGVFSRVWINSALKQELGGE
jgi:peptide/nickel transport system substrate-binding protein